ncbi:MAG: flagellar biosynthesis protein FlhF [Calditrichaeota bacterium]|nr:flagellar biosynthesis protein FlhF [Calditrichota bacterium]
MRIKKYVGRTFQEAFEQMKNELGPEAIILNSRKIKNGGKLDFWGGKEYYEITAGLDSVSPRNGRLRGMANTTESSAATGKATYANAKGARLDTLVQDSPKNGNGTRPADFDFAAWEAERKKILEQLSNIVELRDEISDIKKTLNQVADFLKYSRMPALPELFKEMLKKLVDNEVHEDLAKAIVQTVYSHTHMTDYGKREVVTRNLLNLLGKMIKIAQPLDKIKRTPYVIALVGPTGVGKTTTIAKIAANLKLFFNRRVALISADTYRIAAIEQLQTFANIANIPMSVAYSPQEIREAIYKYKDKEIILIDTVGRSQKHDQHLRDLQKFVDAANPDEVHLVLSLTASLKTMLDVVKRFQLLRPNRFIFSKLDESIHTGNIINILYKHQLPVSFLTTGQTVPNDIVPADRTLLSNLIYKGVLNA